MGIVIVSAAKAGEIKTNFHWTQLSFLSRVGIAMGVCAMFLLGVAHAEPDLNVLSNPGFEDTAQLSPNGLPQGMRFWMEKVEDQNAIAKISLSQEQKSSGQYSVCIERLKGKGNSRVTPWNPIPVTPGGRYYFSCMVKATKGRPGILFGMKNAEKKESNGFVDFYTDAPGVEVSYNGKLIQMAWSKVEEPDKFQRLDAVFTIPDDINALEITLNFSFTLGTAWYDDFKLIPLDMDK